MICIPMEYIVAIILAVLLSSSWSIGHYFFTSKHQSNRTKEQRISEIKPYVPSRISESERQPFYSVFVQPTDPYNEAISKARAEKKRKVLAEAKKNKKQS